MHGVADVVGGERGLCEGTAALQIPQAVGGLGGGPLPAGASQGVRRLTQGQGTAQQVRRPREAAVPERGIPGALPVVEHGVLERNPYREPGQRTRDAYDLTSAGADLTTVLVAMQQWGHAHVPQGPELRVVPLTDGDLYDERGLPR